MIPDARAYCRSRRRACAPGRAAAVAEEEPLWEAGLGVGALSFPDYRGSDERQLYPVPVPYFVYRGDFFKADRDGVRGELFDRDYLEHQRQRQRHHSGA